MGTKLDSFRWPRCATTMSGARGLGPNWTVVSGPGPEPADWVVVVLTCLNGTCDEIIGTFAAPNGQVPRSAGFPKQ